MREDVRTAAGVEAGRATGGGDGRATGVEVGGAAGVGAGTASAIYRGAVSHSRHAIAQHRFQYGIAMVYLDLDELPSLLGGALLDGSLRVLRFRREDYFGDPAKPLAGEVRDRVERETGMRPAGPIRLLTQLRSFGHCFNPVSIYYCLGQDGAEIDALLAEVTNTPWGERHAYVLQPAKPPMPAASSAGPATGSIAKALHVSPFIGMDQTYEWRATVPGDTLSVRFTSRRSAPGAPGAVSSGAGARGAVDFEASLSLARVPLTKRSLASITAKYPAATIRVLGLIYLQAAKLRLEGVPVQPHPRAGGDAGRHRRTASEEGAAGGAGGHVDDGRRT